ncbi:MAG: MBL fold metallo-hydrolase, partial [Bacteroidales bacterium]|nr:MBL fold metallo-hydrolase [Bacteroidales bacterium]
NTYIIVDDRVPTAGEKRQCAIVDPACEASFEDVQLTQYIEQEQLQVTHILLTHAHVDHIAGLRQVCEHWNLPVTMHAEGRKLLKQAEAYGSIMGFAVDNMGDLKVQEIDDNDTIHIGNTEVECRYVPGHCPGSMCFVLHGEKTVITGDALFHFSIGRTDLPGGDYPTLIEKLKTRVLTLPDDYRVLPGHGIASQIGKERKYNSFLI